MRESRGGNDTFRGRNDTLAEALTLSGEGVSYRERREGDGA